MESDSSKVSVRILKREDERNWEQYTLASRNATIYHQIGWKNIIEKTYGLRSFYLIAESKSEVAGILPLFLIKSKLFPTHLVSLPFLNYGGICADRVDVESQLIMKAVSLMRDVGAKYIQMHHLDKHGASLASREDKVTSLLRLDNNPDVLWKSFKPKVRNQVRKAERSGLVVKTGGIEYLDNFYDAFAVNMKDLGSPVHSKALFANLMQEFSDSTRIFIVYLGSETVGGAIFVSFKDTADVPWASSKREYFKYCPNNLLYWEIIKYACEQGFRYFDFGRSTKGSGNYNFKIQWGSEPKQLYWQFYLSDGVQVPEISYNGLKHRVMTGTWKRLPLSVTKALGPKIRKSISA